MPNLDYANYNFEEAVVQIQDRLKAKASWGDTYRSGTGQMLVEFHAYVMNLVMWYVERAAQESYLGTARNRSSIINLVRLLGYTPKRATSATGTITFTIPAAHSENIYFPKYTMVSTDNEVEFHVTQDAVLLAGQTTVSASIKQGTKNDVQITSDGSLNQEYQLVYTDIENSGIEVYVNDILWTKVDSFILGDPTSTWYKVISNLDDTLILTFGDGVTSKIPISGDNILVRFIRTKGLNGNVYSVGAISNLDSVIFDATSARISDITVSNADVLLGGDDAESTEEIRTEAPSVYATGDRAVTKDDYKAILDNYAGIASSNAWGENEENPPNYDMFNRVKICLMLQGWNLPSTSFKQTLSEYLYTKAQLTVKYTFVDPTIVYVVPTVAIYVTKGFTLSTVQSSVEDGILAQFDLGNTTKLGVSKRLSDLTYNVEAITGVSYVHLALDIYKELTLNYASGYDFGTTVDALTIKPSTVGIYINGELSAEDDGSGVFTDLSSEFGVSGTVDYSTGEVLVNITPTLAETDVVSVRYEQNSSGDVVVTQNQIAKMLEVDVTSISYDA